MDFLLYGAYGYTGTLVARFAAEQGLRPLLAGRKGARLAPLAEQYGFDAEAFDLEDREALDAALAQVPVVLHCAGPFSRTARAMAEACLRTKTHYLDINGDIEVFEMLATMDAVGRGAGVMIMPGVGFDVVPSDCLAVHLKRRLPSATHLELAFMATGGISHGTATTMVEKIEKGGAIRQDGRIVPVPPAWKTRAVDFGRGPKTVVSIPWGDVSMAYFSTGIPNIITYVGVPKATRVLMRLSRPLSGLLGSKPVQRFMKARIDSRPAGPSDEDRAKGTGIVWGQARDADTGAVATARYHGPEGYTLTALAALQIVGNVLKGQAPAGFHTPAMAYGPDLILTIDGTSRVDLDEVTASSSHN